MLSSAIHSSTETGKLQVMHLMRYWDKSILKRNGKIKEDAFHEEWQTDVTLLNVLDIGLEQTVKYLYQNAPSFDQFENWIAEVTGGIDQQKAIQFNTLFLNSTVDVKEQNTNGQALTPEEHNFWQQNGYLIIRNAVSKTICDQTIQALCNHININRNDSSTWYKEHPDKQGIMVQLFQHPLLQQNRNNVKIRKVYEELWQRTDIWASTDRVSFNPPQNDLHTFQGPYLHWDVSLELPIPFGLQGLLYLSDTAENQGAFTLVPGFHRQIENWLNNLPPDANPRNENLYALGVKSIAANAGDFIIWNQALPHGSSPNKSATPRFVQYINYAPLNTDNNSVWK